MSNEERIRQNRPRFSWEVTIADVSQLLVLVAMAVKLYDQVQVHEAHFVVSDARIAANESDLGIIKADIAVLQDRQNLRMDESTRIRPEHGNGGK